MAKNYNKGVNVAKYLFDEGMIPEHKFVKICWGKNSSRKRYYFGNEKRK